jgi:hypothetical protein
MPCEVNGRVAWSENPKWVEELVEAYQQGATHPRSLQKKLGWDLPSKKIGSKIAQLVKEGKLVRPARRFAPASIAAILTSASALTASELVTEMSNENVVRIATAALTSINVPTPDVQAEASPAVPVESEISPPRNGSRKRRFSLIQDDLCPYWVHEDEMRVSVWYLRLPYSSNTVTATDYTVMIDWELPPPPEEVFFLSNYHASIYYLHLRPKAGRFTIHATSQIQQDQAKWKRDIKGCWIYLEIPKITSIMEKEFSF